MRANRRYFTFLSVLFLFFTISSFAISSIARSDESLNLRDVIAKAELYNPDVKAAIQSERAASEGIRIQQSLYYPTLEATAVDSTGFPASASAPVGFNGLMGSPFRVGLTGGVYTTVTLFDLTREYGVQAAKLGMQAAQEQTEVTRLMTDMRAMNLFMDAVVSREQRDAWKGIQFEIDRLYKIVKKFVKNGQYSEVTEWLLKDQAEKALLKQEVFDQAYNQSLRRIEILIGAPQGSVSLKDSTDFNSVFSGFSKNIPPESPLITNPEFEAQTAHAAVSQQAAQNYPRLLGIASAGGMKDARLVQEQNYSAWVGLTFPIFEGFRISAEEQQARAQAERSDDLVNEARLDLADADARYTEQAKTHEIEFQHYKIEKEYSLKALKLAEHRYVTFVGDLADVRDALYSYEEAESGLNASKIEFFRSKFAGAIAKGASMTAPR